MSTVFDNRDSTASKDDEVARLRVSMLPGESAAEDWFIQNQLHAMQAMRGIVAADIAVQHHAF